MDPLEMNKPQTYGGHVWVGPPLYVDNNGGGLIQGEGI